MLKKKKKVKPFKNLQSAVFFVTTRKTAILQTADFICSIRISG